MKKIVNLEMFVNEYITKGYCISYQVVDKNQISLLRDELNKEFSFQEKNKPVRKLIDFKNTELAKKIVNLFNHSSIQRVITELRERYDTNVTILPSFSVHKNYHVNLKEFHGWHRDCGGELRYDYCKDIISSKNYFFSKIGIYLQKNGEYGGSIDIIKKSHKNFSNSRYFIRKIKNIPLRILILFHKYFNKIYNSIPEKFFMFFLNAKKLNPKLGSAVFFDSRITHRGSPIDKKLNDVNYTAGKYVAQIPESVNKFSIYCQVGTTQSIDSYMYDRLKREETSGELKLWVREIDFISKFDKNLSEEINLVINPIKKKYAKYLS